METNCYECKHRGGVAGSAHSSCQHPKNKVALENPMAQVMSILGSVGRVDPVQVNTGLKVKGHPQGIKNGWFNHPFNFDPVWLLECNGFELPEKKA